jgi:hypothetical protein
MCRKSLKKSNHIDCKITTFEVKKRAFFTSNKRGFANFIASWLKTFALYKVEAFDIVLGNWVENLLKNNNPKYLYFHSLKGHQIGGGM